MRISYLPIDERPCNTVYVEMIAHSQSDVTLVMPPREYFGYKKKPANTEKLWEWVLQEAPVTDALVICVDMLIYGGLIPSRLHSLSEDAGLKWINRLRSLHKSYPNLKIYAANVIMRTPKYSSNDEEPDYYQHWGKELFLRSYLQDKGNRENLTDEERKTLADLEGNLPKEFINDYENRRKFNSFVNTMMLELVSDGVIHYLTIPQDDSSEYGYTAMDQLTVIKKREQLRLNNKVYMYPGSDEVGATLLARVYNELNGQSPKIFPIWSSTLGPQLVPLYEDRPFYESLKAHILAAGCRLAESGESADIILAYNTPGRVMQEAWEQDNKDVTYTSFRNLLTFAEQIKGFLQSGKNVAVADSAFANGGDRELIALLDEKRILDQLLSYKGWNTNCNTLGTTISQAVLGLNGIRDTIKYNLLYHLFDDYIYQAEVKMDMVKEFLPKLDLNYFDLKDKAEIVNSERNARLLAKYKECVRESFKDIEIEDVKSYSPWNRMFEVGMELKIKTVLPC